MAAHVHKPNCSCITCCIMLPGALRRSAGPRFGEQGGERRPRPQGHAHGQPASGARHIDQGTRLVEQEYAKVLAAEPIFHISFSTIHIESCAGYPDSNCAKTHQSPNMVQSHFQAIVAIRSPTYAAVKIFTATQPHRKKITGANVAAVVRSPSPMSRLRPRITLAEHRARHANILPRQWCGVIGCGECHHLASVMGSVWRR